MATGDYNSPYTGQQLDDTIRKISTNSLHSYTKVFDNPVGAQVVSINSLPSDQNGLRSGVYDVIYAGAAGGASWDSTSRINIHNLNNEASGTGRTNSAVNGTNIEIRLSNVHFSVADQSLRAVRDTVTVSTDANTGASSVPDTPMYIYAIYRQDTIA